MLFDFDRFTIAAKLAYRKVSDCAYSFEDVLSVFRYYFDTYEYVFAAPHPMISVRQISRIIEDMPYVSPVKGEKQTIEDIEPEAYEAMIDQHFATDYKSGCDYNINHFFSGRIRELRYFETLY